MRQSLKVFWSYQPHYQEVVKKLCIDPIQVTFHCGGFCQAEVVKGHPEWEDGKTDILISFVSEPFLWEIHGKR